MISRKLKKIVCFKSKLFKSSEIPKNKNEVSV